MLSIQSFFEEFVFFFDDIQNWISVILRSCCENDKFINFVQLLQKFVQMRPRSQNSSSDFVDSVVYQRLVQIQHQRKSFFAVYRKIQIRNVFVQIRLLKRIVKCQNIARFYAIRTYFATKIIVQCFQ